MAGPTPESAPPPAGDKALSFARADARGLIFSAFVFSVFANLLMLTGPLFMLQIYDRVLASRSGETLTALFALVTLLYLLLWLLDFARGRVMARVGTRLEAALAERTFRAVQRRAVLGRGPRSGAVSDLETLRAFFAAPVLTALFDIPWTLLFMAAIFVFHPLLGWLALGGGGALIAVTAFNHVTTAGRAAVAAGQAREAAEFASDAERGAGLLQAQGMVGPVSRRWQRMQLDAAGLTTRLADRTGGLTSLTRAIRLFLQSAMLALGAWLVLEGELTAGAMIAASILLGRALAPVEIALGQWPFIQRALSAWAGLAQLFRAFPDNGTRTALPRPEARLEVRDLATMPRRHGPPLLRNVSLTVRPGEALGVIGRSGAGKTTLARALVGLVQPAAGEVRLGGATLGQYGNLQLGQVIGYLPQEVFFFPGSVAENIARMAPDPDPVRVVDAARRAGVHDVVLRLPQGYDTRIEGDGTPLSGGERQRLGLARALFGNPVLLVLDEPNSALDADGSWALNAAVAAQKAAGGAVVVMTHRPTAIAACDRLLVLEAGRVAAVGPRDDIVRSMMRNAGDVQRVLQEASG